MRPVRSAHEQLGVIGGSGCGGVGGGAGAAVGSPGTGKTSAVVALGEALGWPVETVIGSIREPSDFAGLPVVIDGSVQLSPPAWATRLCEAVGGSCSWTS